jgi:fatty-acyl-CoA synthase
MLYGQMMKYPLTTHSIIEYGNRVFPHREIVSKMPDGTRHRYTFADLYQRSKKLSSSLIRLLDVQPGDRIATFAWNHFQHMELYYAIPGAGAICHTLNVRLSSDQLEFIVNHAEDKLIFVDASLIPLIEKFASRLTSVEHFILMNAKAGTETSLPNIIYYEELISQGDPSFDWVEVDENQACALSYTSGTTGNPKGALYSHRSTYLHAITSLSPNVTNISSKDRVLAITPLFHAMAWGFPFICLFAGADIVMPSCHLQPASLVDMIRKEKITIANGVPTIWLGIYEELKNNPPSEKLLLKEFTVGGSAVPPSLIERLEKNFGISCFHAWGMTETSPIVTASRLQLSHGSLSDEEKIKVKAKQGIELPGVEIRVIQKDGKVAPRDGKTVGEFEVRGHWVISSYYKMQKEETQFSEDGWFKTGDVGTIDELGYMELTDRTKDLIKSGGEWISSVALETTLMSHPKIKEASVIAIPDEKWLECPLACMVVEPGEVVSEKELNEYLLKSFVKYQLPKHYISVKEIPKTSVGKFDKKEMRKLFAAGKLI